MQTCFMLASEAQLTVEPQKRKAHWEVSASVVLFGAVMAGGWRKLFMMSWDSQGLRQPQTSPGSSPRSAQETQGCRQGTRGSQSPPAQSPQGSPVCSPHCCRPLQPRLLLCSPPEAGPGWVAQGVWELGWGWPGDRGSVSRAERLWTAEAWEPSKGHPVWSLSLRLPVASFPSSL